MFDARLSVSGQVLPGSCDMKEVTFDSEHDLLRSSGPKRELLVDETLPRHKCSSYDTINELSA